MLSLLVGSMVYVAIYLIFFFFKEGVCFCFVFVCIPFLCLLDQKTVC